MVSGVTMTSGTIIGVRGETDLTNGTLFGNGGSIYAYGVDGKIVGGTSTINAGSGYVTGALGQLDLTGTTTTSGHIAAVIASIQGVGAGAIAPNMFYGESATGTPINAYFMAFGKAAYVMDLESNVYPTLMSLAGTYTTPGAAHGWLKIRVEGNDRYIPLSAAVS
jgi:hypothetical protein